MNPSAATLAGPRAAMLGRAGEAPGAEALEVLSGLRRAQPVVAPRYLYDETGSRLFDEICRQPEYYPTRTELSILERHCQAMADALGPEVLLVEPGSGAADKTLLLLRALTRPAGYVPIDVAGPQLTQASRRLATALGHEHQLRITPVCADFTRDLALPAAGAHRRKVVFFPGSTIGNFDDEESRALLRRFRRIAGSGGGLLIGVDLIKAPGLLHQAYNDAAGVTARFNLNVLDHLNHRFGADFDTAAFRHAAEWRPERSHVEMQLWLRRDQLVRFAGEQLVFPAGSRIVTEWSHKYTLQTFRELATGSGWVPKQVWTDDARWFSVHYLEAKA